MSVVRTVLFLLALFAMTAAAAQEPAQPPDLVLKGKLTRADHQQYRSAPFRVPRGVKRLVIAFDHDGRADRTVIDLGVEDAQRFRGASGGDKALISIAERDATPSYFPGRIDPGIWRLTLAIPNIRAKAVTKWTARLWFLTAAASLTPVPVVDRGPGWYRGDLHLHTAHSDGACASQSGQRVPCPVFKTLETAAARGLDFIAVTDHNTPSALASIAEAQPYFDRLLIIPGREITTFFGHFNIFGTAEPIDYRVTPNGPVTFNAIADRVHALGGLVSINHPGLPSGEACMGCGWAMPGADLGRADAIEVINGGAMALPGGVEGRLSGLGLWVRAIAAPQPITAIGGSDNHDAGRTENAPGTIGLPTTVVHAEALTQAAILQGIRQGRVFIDLAGDPAVLLDLRVEAGASQALMGGRLRVAASEVATAHVSASAAAGATLEVLVDEKLLARVALLPGKDVQVPLTGLVTGTSVVRAVVRDTRGSIVLMSNAVLIDR